MILAGLTAGEKDEGYKREVWVDLMIPEKVESPTLSRHNGSI